MYQYNKQQPRGIPGPTGPKGIDGKSIVFQGMWNNGTNYKKGDLVRDNDGNVYAALVDNVSYDPSSTPSVWGLFLQDGSSGSITDHGALYGLTDDDHTQYSKVDGTRAYTGKVSYNAHPTFITDTEIVDKKYVDDRDALKANISGATFTGDISVPDEAYGVDWNGSMEVPTKNAVYDKIETMGGGGATTFLGLTDTPSSYSGQAGKFTKVNAGETALEFVTITGGGDALTSNPLSQFASTTSAQLAGVISDETGTGSLVFANSPTITNPKISITKATTGDNVLELADGIGNGIGTSTLKITSRYDGVSDGYFEITTNTPATNGRIDIYAKGTGAVNISRLNATSPTFITPTLGTPASGTLTNCTGLPLAGVVDSTTEALGVGSLEVGHASDTTISRSSAGVIAVEGVVIPSVSSTNTLTNKTLIDTTNVITENSTTTSSATPAPTGGSLRNFYTITALAAGATFSAPSGTPANGNLLLIRVKDNGTARTLAWNAIYRAGNTALPTTTVISKTMYLLFVYNSADSKWDLLSYNDNF